MFHQNLKTLITRSARYIQASLAILLFALPIHAFARDVYNMNADWKFIKEDVSGGEKTQLDDQAWQEVSLPHTFNDSDTFDNFCRGGHKGEEDQFRGTVWYRKHFSLPAEAAGKRVFIEFEGVRQIAEVYLNGKKLGTDNTGFIPFGFELTDGIQFGKENVLAVRVNNDRLHPFSQKTPYASNEDNPTPWNYESWHPIFGGIYRNVTLTVVEPVHVTLPLYSNIGGQGAYAYSIQNSADSVTAGIEVEVANALAETVNAHVEVSVKDENGTQVAQTVLSEKRVSTGSQEVFKGELFWEDPIRWEPARPHVYTIELAVKLGEQLVDQSSIPFGVRTFAFTPDKGVIINDRHNKMRGWGQKPTQGWPGLGGAIQNWQRELTLRLMQEAGGNFLRWGHCAGSPYEATLSDRYGIVTMMPGVDGERDCEGEAWQTRSRAFRDLIIRYRNHPSIFVWEGGNYHVSAEHSAELKAHITRWDPHGQRGFGLRMANGDNEKDVTVELSTQGTRPFYDHLGCIESEYFRSESPRRVWDKQSPPHFGYKDGDKKGNSFNLTQEAYTLDAVEFWWDSFGSRLWHGGGANWIFSDGTHGGRMVIEVARVSGEVDAVRLPKESYWAHQAMWRPDPQVQIIGHWTYPEETSKDLYVVANTESVELILNGESLGKGERSHNHLFTWKDVKFARGELKAVGFIGDQKVAKQIERTAGEAVALRLTPIAAPGGWRADGSDVILVDVEVVDAAGNRCPTDQAPVKFTLSGEAEWRGGYNSGQEATVLKTTLDTECGINRVALRATRQAGAAILKAERDGLEPALLEVQSVLYETTGGLSTIMPAEFTFLSTDAYPYAPYRTYDAVETERPGASGTSVFKSVNYTGNGPSMVIKDIDNGMAAYSDFVVKRLKKLPKELKGSELIRIPSNEGKLWANDLLVVTAGEEITLYVAHHSKLENKPLWLNEFKKTNQTLQVTGMRGEYDLFKRDVKKGQTLSFSGNLDQDEAQSVKGPVYNFILFGKPK